MRNLRDCTHDDLLGLVASLGERPYRAGQIYRWVFSRGVSSIDEMTDLSIDLRGRLKEACTIEALTVAGTLVSADGTVKVIYRLGGGGFVQSVVMPEGERATVCVSTQSGCALGCAFCLTGRGGFRRNLTLAEMAGQVLHARKIIGEGGEVTNIVFMGMGEPLLNYDTLVAFIRILTDPAGFAISHNRITVSTAGITPAIDRFGREGLKVNLAISLNAPTDALRTRLMPVNRRYPLAGLMEALRAYPLPGKKRLTLEYVLLGGINDRPGDARRLLALIRGLRCKVNLIPFNPFEGAPYRRPSDEAVAEFRDILMKGGYLAVIRKSRGADIGAACGQLGRGVMAGRAARGGHEAEKTLEARGS